MHAFLCKNQLICDRDDHCSGIYVRFYLFFASGLHRVSLNLEPRAAAGYLCLQWDVVDWLSGMMENAEKAKASLKRTCHDVISRCIAVTSPKNRTDKVPQTWPFEIDHFSSSSPHIIDIFVLAIHCYGCRRVAAVVRSTRMRICLELRRQKQQQHYAANEYIMIVVCGCFCGLGTVVREALIFESAAHVCIFAYQKIWIIDRHQLKNHTLKMANVPFGRNCWYK